MLSRRALVFLLLATFSSSLLATSLNIGPLAEVDELAVQVMIGDTLAVEGERSSRLFDGEQSVDVPKAAIASRVNERLLAGGLRVKEESATVLDVSIFGGKFDDSHSQANFFLIEVSVCREDEGPCGPSRSILGVASDSRLTGELAESAAAVVQEFVDQRARFREGRK